MINWKARFLFWLIVVLVSLASLSVVAQEIVLGQYTEMSISVCLSKEDAIEVIKSDNPSQTFNDKDKCNNFSVVFKPVKVVGVQGDSKVIEVLIGNQTAYWLTQLPVKGYRRV